MSPMAGLSVWHSRLQRSPHREGLCLCVEAKKGRAEQRLQSLSQLAHRNPRPQSGIFSLKSPLREMHRARTNQCTTEEEINAVKRPKEEAAAAREGECWRGLALQLAKASSRAATQRASAFR